MSQTFLQMLNLCANIQISRLNIFMAVCHHGVYLILHRAPSFKNALLELSKSHYFLLMLLKPNRDRTECSSCVMTMSLLRD